MKLKRIQRSKQITIYDVEKIGLDYGIEITNRFNELTIKYIEPEELWNDIRNILKETAYKKVPKVKRKKVSKWLSEEALKIAQERKEMRRKGKYEEYRKLNATFHKKSRQDKEQSIIDKCNQIEDNNKMSKTRDLFKEIKIMTESPSSSCGAMKLNTGRVVSEEKDIKKRWQKYSENLYRRDPNINDIFNENLYEDEPGVLEIEVK